ncbi:DUF58 domain-containing protein [Agromyces aerolatus]|uniref:DUF58 domain-containing protein n=1 Tax=Agromyces sp. LY-1074 TaxID=3074080 RepID=UPI0028651459|nr:MULTISPECIES: DUF58 domain-containing protein [unclassified Agromyces]MDR5699844.1 DUF58 domain-containing protein [Agromyces sp. LY-1074]MDR5706344.1 DUF58 domain-containing protein [Agromyces sp. LY-1358]
MAVSARFVWLLALGVVPVVVAGLADASAGWLALAAWLFIAAGLGAVDLSLAASPREVAFERELPDRVRLGEPVEAVLFVRNLGPRMLRATVRDAWQPSAGVIGDGRGRLSIPPGERRRLTLRLVPWRRGDRRVDDVTVRSAGPLGLWSRQATLAAPARLRVLPPFHSRVHLPARITRLRELDGRTPLLVRGQGTEFDSIREYVRGDDVRSIDWRATARHPDPESPGASKLMVRTWRPERDRRIVIVADTSRTSAARIADEPRIDTAFEASLLLAAVASYAGDRVDFLAWDRRVRGRVHGTSGAPLLAGMVDAMATIDPELIEADWAAVPAQVRALTSHRALVVLLTSADSPGSARGLLAVLPQLTANHTVVVASVLDPDAVAAARRRSDLDEVYGAAAAERGLLEAEGVAAAIRRLGAEVVSAPPAELPPALADRYLDLKAAGRL